MGMSETARAFFDACETGGGWAACAEFCHEGATFSSQGETLAAITSLEDYANWMRDLFGPIPDGRYELNAFSADEARGVVTGFAVFMGAQTGPGPVDPPTGRAVASEYVYAMAFDGDKIRHVTKIWNDAHALTQLGWA